MLAVAGIAATVLAAGYGAGTALRQHTGPHAAVLAPLPPGHAAAAQAGRNKDNKTSAPGSGAPAPDRGLIQAHELHLAHVLHLEHWHALHVLHLAHVGARYHGYG
jgi:hypothetical protein